MPRHRFLSLATIIAVVITLLTSALAAANPPAPGDLPTGAYGKPLDRPNLADFERNRARQRLLESGQTLEAQSLALTSSAHALVVLVEFGGVDAFTWKPGDTWDPLGRADPDEAVYDENGQVIVGDCSNIITQTQTFTYSGPLHNQVPRPLSASDRSGEAIWTPDFSKGWFEALLFGNGVKFNYARQDGSVVSEDFTGQSVRDYFLDMSGGRHEVSGDVIGWVTLPHSTQWYAADACPGRRSGEGGVSPAGGIPNAGDERSFVADTLNAVNAISNTLPGFKWQNYDGDRDGLIDRLWIVHAGYGEEEDATLLNRTAYGEGALWSRSNSAAPPIPVAADVAVGPYLIMPENGGMAVFAHEHGHSLGAIDLHAQEGGDPSAGFWTPMADDWTGYPIGFEPAALDPLHLDAWGWLEPLVIDDPSREYVFKLGQASRFPQGEGFYRGAKIELPDGGRELPVPVWQGARYWWGGNEALANGRMTLRKPVLIPPEGATLTFDTAYRTRSGIDFLWVQASEDGGATWTMLTNGNTTCAHAADWIGAAYGFPDDLCAAGISGFTGSNTGYPAPTGQEFDLTAFAGKPITLRFWHMTDAGAPLDGPFVDNVRVAAAEILLFFDDAEGPDTRWTVDAPWAFSHGSHAFTQNYYLQWRNVGASGGYDSALGDSRWRFGPANGGLLVWLNNNHYADNEISRTLRDYPSFGPKGKLLVVDAHPQPYRDPGVVAAGFSNEGANLPARGQMRDAPFSLKDSAPFKYPSAMPGSTEWVSYAERPAVSAFHDSFGYYPGAEFVNRGPGHSQTLPRWITRQWDASAVLPATAGYGMRAPMMRYDSPLLYRCRPNLAGPAAGLLDCYAYQFGLGYEGGTGNPGDALAQYGWHVEILDQTDEVATVRVWNARKAFTGSVTQTSNTQPAIKGSAVKADVQATNIGSPATALFIAPLDDEEEYVAGSAYGGAFPVTAAQASQMAGVATAAGLSPDAEANKVVAVAATSTLATGGAARFGFSTRITADRGEITRSVAVFEGATFLNALESGALTIGQAAQTVTQEFGAVADAHISSGIPRTNYGQWPFIYIGGNDVLRSLLRFDLSPINATYPVDEATLYIYVTAYGGGGSTANVASYEVTAPWQEGTVTWKTPWRTPGGDALTVADGLTPVTKADVGKWVRVDVTDMARKWVANPGANNGLLLRLVDATSFTTYRLVSRDNGWMRPYAPKLVVTYRKP